MEDLIRDRLPHAPQMGLFVVPDIPSDRLQRALSSYASDVHADDVRALYDATLSGTGGDGAVFTADRVVFQNNNLQSAQTVRYADLVDVDARARWFGLAGRVVDLTVNRGRATFELTLDFSGAPEASEHVASLLEAAMLRDVQFGSEESSETDVAAVRRALDRLRTTGALRPADYEELVETLDEIAERSN